MLRLILAACLVLALAGCISMPTQYRGATRAEQHTEIAYDDAYRIIAKQMTACYRVIGIWGNGYEIQADLDTTKRQGIVELYKIGLMGTAKDGDNITRKVTITATESGAYIIVDGHKDRYVFVNSSAITQWLGGSTACYSR
ncbi:hypothetical protein [Stenotrophomonas sp. MMGLT7]|uniref:hypothetical protein n=1 Tax=Stenotrophomonas sp. MMGLT7 TaxID=2901227 RepID=UPI001E5F88D8|nr:hypothetical protein [Stenotrophomonas sp. MMGLT7]MCD7096948.1 hypothetical protein [Stenotrophomonas sp. MMGLT7]